MLSQLKRVTNGIYRDFSNIAVCLTQLNRVTYVLTNM